MTTSDMPGYRTGTAYRWDDDVVVHDAGRGHTVVSTYGDVVHRIPMPAVQTGLLGLANLYSSVLVVDVSLPAWNGPSTNIKTPPGGTPIPVPNLNNLLGEGYGLQPRPGNMPGQYLFEYDGDFYQYGGPLQTGASPQSTAIYDVQAGFAPPTYVGNQLSGAQLWFFLDQNPPYVEVRHVDGTVARFDTFQAYANVSGSPWVPPGPSQRLWRLTQVRDAYDNIATFNYNAYNQLTSISFPSGITQNFGWATPVQAGPVWPNWSGFDVLQISYTTSGSTPAEVAARTWGLVFEDAGFQNGKYFGRRLHRAYSPPRGVLVDRATPGPLTIGAGSVMNAQIIHEFSYDPSGTPWVRETQKAHSGTAFDRILTTPSDLTDKVVMETTFSGNLVGTQTHSMIAESMAFSYPAVTAVPGLSMAGIEVALLSGAAPQTARRYEYDMTSGRVYRVTTTPTVGFEGRPRAFHATTENQNIGGVATSDVEPNSLIIENDYNGTCVCNKPSERREISVRNGQTVTRTWNFEYHPVNKMVTKKKAPNPQAGGGSYSAQVEWNYTYTQLVGSGSWGAWVPATEATPDGTFTYTYPSTDLATRAITGHGQMARTSVRSLAGVRVQTTLTGLDSTSPTPVEEIVWRNLPNLPGSLPFMGSVRGQPRKVINGDGVETTFEYSTPGFLTATTVVGNAQTGNLRTTFVPDGNGDVTSTTINATSTIPATTTLVRMLGTGAPTSLLSTSAGTLREARALYDRFGHFAVVQQNNLSSEGTPPTQHNASGSARGWVEHQREYHFSRLMATYVDRKPLDEAAGSGQFMVTEYHYTADGRLEWTRNPNGSTTWFDFDGYGTLYRTITKDPTGNLQVRSPKTFMSPFLELTGTYEYTGSDHLWTLFTRNTAGAITHITEPQTQAPTGYTPANGVNYSTGGAVHQLQLDKLGRVTQIDTISGSTLLRSTTLRHDQLGRQIWRKDVGIGFSAGDIHSAWKYLDGKASQLERLEHTGNGVASMASTYTWNLLGLLTKVTDSFGSGNFVLYTHHKDTDYLRYLTRVDLDSQGGTRTTETEYFVNPFGQVTKARELGPNHPTYQFLDHLYAYNSLGRVDRYTDPAAKLQKFLPDGLGRIVEHVRVGSSDFIRNSTTFADFGVGSDGRTKVTRSDGLDHKTITHYDFAGRPFIVQNPGGDTEPTSGAKHQIMSLYAEYDGASRLAALYDGDLGKTEFLRDGPGRVIQRRLVNQGSSSNSTGSFKNIAQWNTLDWLRRDALGRIGQSDYWGSETGGAIMGAEFFDHDSHGRVHAERYISAFAPAHTLQVNSAFASGAFRTRLNYQDNMGQETARMDYSRDAIGRLTEVQWDRTPGGVGTMHSLAQYGWVGSLRRHRTVQYSSATYPQGRSLFSYDEYSRLTQIKDDVFTASSASATKSLFDYEYDRASNLTKEKYAKVTANGWAGVGDRFAYDSYHRLQQAWQGVDTTTMNDPSDPTSFSSSAIHEHLTYSLDKANNRTSTSSQVGASPQTTTYARQSDTHWQGASNRYDTVQMPGASVATLLEYDERGNLKYDGRFLYRYDYLNRLQEVWRVLPDGEQGDGQEKYAVVQQGALDEATEAVKLEVPDIYTRLAREHTNPTFRARLKASISGGVLRIAPTPQGGGGRPGWLPVDGDLELAAVYVYDAFNRRTLSILLDTVQETQIHAWDGWRQVTQHTLEPVAGVWQATTTKQFMWGSRLDELVAYRRKVGSTWESYYLLHGGQDTAAKLIDSAGTVVEQYEYDPYGRAACYRQVSGTWTPFPLSQFGLPFLWKAVRVDDITGLLQMRNRYYTVELGRFLSPDPLGVWADVLNLGSEYAYGGNIPLVVGDPLGLQGQRFNSRWIVDQQGNVVSNPDYVDLNPPPPPPNPNNNSDKCYACHPPDRKQPPMGEPLEGVAGVAVGVAAFGTLFLFEEFCGVFTGIAGALVNAAQGNVGAAAFDLVTALPGVPGGNTIRVGGRLIDDACHMAMFGARGVQTASKTLWKKGKGRLDIENPNPGKRPGQIHFQDEKGNKYLYDPSTGTFPDAPNAVNDMIEGDSSFADAIEKALRFLGEGG